MKSQKKFLALLLLFSVSAFFSACSGGGGKGEGVSLITEPVDTGGSGDNGTSPDGEPYTADIFNSQPGSKIMLSRYAPAVDPVGTALTEDFDGDGISNDKETTSNAWVADYPVVETNIATPVTMRIEILATETSTTETLSTNISSSDVTSNKDYSSEKKHRREIKTKTIHYKNKCNIKKSHTEEIKKRVSASAGIDVKVASFGSSASASKKTIDSRSRSYTSHSIRWKDVPFKNHLSSKSWSMKSNEAARNAFQMRREAREKTNGKYEIKPNAGYIRAALYISNESVNLPVKLSNILCSLMFETPEGQLIPVQSFRLRNDDYSIFELELYGDTTFGPYVIELTNLNTMEIREAVSKGYNPKIFIVDYEMKHVQDSNYRQALSSSFTGDNLKIIEENAKGRTAGIKFIDHETREFYRVVAFDNDGTEDRMGATGSTYISPGVSLEKALARISFSGKNFEFANYVFDFSSYDPGSEFPLIFMRGIKSIDGSDTTLPIRKVIEGPEGTTYIVKPIAEMTEEELENMTFWAVYADGRYYSHAGDDVDINGNLQYFTYQVEENGQMVEKQAVKIIGIKGTIWPGDHYDIVNINLKEYLHLETEYGKNPSQTNEILTLNTRWNSKGLGEYPFYTDRNTIYLGEAILGDTIELKVKLDSTKYLNPDFGTPQNEGNNSVYWDFNYDFERKESTKKFSYPEAVDLELGFGLGGNYEHWVNLDPTRRVGSLYENAVSTDVSWDYLNQEFTIKVTLPSAMDGVDSEKGIVKLYIRTALNNAYRDTFWPYKYSNVKKFRGQLYDDFFSGAESITVNNVRGTIEAGDQLYITSNGTTETCSVSSVACNTSSNTYDIALSAGLQNDHSKEAEIYINLAQPLTEPEVRVSIFNDFVSDWNTGLGWDGTGWNWSDTMAPLYTAGQTVYSPVQDLGYTSSAIVSNYLGNNNYCNPYLNNWSDGSYLETGYPYLSMLGVGPNNYWFYLQDSLDRNYNNQDFVVNTDYLGTHSNIVRATPYNDKVLIIWQQKDVSGNWNLYGKMIDAKTGNILADNLKLNSVPLFDPDYCEIVKQGTTAFAVWHSADSDIYGRFIDLENNALHGSNDFLISNSNSGEQKLPHIAAKGEKAIVVWRSNDDGVDYRVRGRIYNITTRSAVGDDFVISSLANTASTYNYQTVTMTETRALVIWDEGLNPDTNIRGRFIDITNGLPIGSSDFLVSTTNSNIQDYQYCLTYNNIVLTMWRSKDNGSDYYLRGRYFDMENTTAISSNDFLIANEPGYYFHPSGLVNENGIALLVWSIPDDTYYNVKGRRINFKNQTFIDSNDFYVNTFDNNNNQLTYRDAVANINNKLMINWYSYDNGTDANIRGRFYDLEKGVFDGNDFLVSTKNSDDQVVCSIVATDNYFINVWVNEWTSNSFNVRSRIFRHDNSYMYLPNGKSNFFVAPLIERNYSVTAKILED